MDILVYRPDEIEEWRDVPQAFVTTAVLKAVFFMKTMADLVKGRISKADSDLANAQLCLAVNASLDMACFHAQRIAENLIKAYLMAYNLLVSFIHNLEKLIDLCEQQDVSFS